MKRIYVPLGNKNKHLCVYIICDSSLVPVNSFEISFKYIGKKNYHSNLSSELRKKVTYLLMPPTSDPKHINLIGTANVDDPACGFGLWIITDSLLLTWSSSYSTKSLSTRIKWSRLSDLKSKFETYFLKSKFFFPIWILIVLIYVCMYFAFSYSTIMTK